jgi:hypothetical protein
MPLAALVLIALAFSPTVPVTAQGAANRAELRKAMGPALAALKDKNIVDDTVTAIEPLEGLLDYDAAIELLGYYEECDRVWDAYTGDKNAPKNARARPLESFRIAHAILACVRRMNYPDEAAKFSKKGDIADTEKWSLRPRMAMLDAIARNADDDAECLTVLKDLANNQDGDMDLRIVAISHLGDHASANDVQAQLMLTLRDPSWRIRDVSIEVLASVARDSTNESQILLAMINALAQESGKMRQTIRDALRKITGQTLGTDPDEWSEWFRTRRRGGDGLPPKKGGDRGTRVKIFETENFSDRYVFVLDTSTSMTDKISAEEKEKLKKSITSAPGEAKDPRRPLDWSKINNKLDLAREEIIRSLEVLDPKLTKFTVISFSEEITYWEQELVPTSPEKINEASEWLRALKGKKRTNVFGGLDAAYDLSERLAGIEVDKRGKKKRDKDKIVTGQHRDEALPDTIFLYTDGWATYGKYSSDDNAWKKFSLQEKTKMYHNIMRDMKVEIQDRNRVARITVNTIGVGNPQDNYTLKAVANMTGGQYIAIGK